MNEETETIEPIIEAHPMSLVMNLHEITGIGDKRINTLTYGKKRVYNSISGSIAENWETAIVGYEFPKSMCPSWREILEGQSYEETVRVDEEVDETTGEVLKSESVECIFVNGFGYDILLELANFRMASLEGSITNLEEFISAVDTVLEKTFKFMYTYCDIAYTENIVYNTTNKELNFNREHVIIILACAHVYRIAVPLILSFFVENPTFSIDGIPQQETLNTLILEYFLNAMEKIQTFVGRPINMQNKLHRLVETRVRSTEYSDSVIWAYIKNIGTTPVEAIHPLYKKLITDITPKLTLNENVINLYHVVVKKQLQFMFRANIPLTYESVNSSIEADEASVFDTEVNKFSQNEIYTVLVDAGYNDLVKAIKSSIGNGITVTEDELQEYTGEIIPSYETNCIFFSIYGKYADDYEILYKLSKRRYTYLMLMLSKILEKYGMPNLAKVIMSNQEKTKITATKVKLNKRLTQIIRESSSYKELQEKYFTAIKERFNKNNTLFSILENIIKSSRITILPNEEGDYEQVVIDDEAVSDELLKLTKIIL